MNTSNPRPQTGGFSSIGLLILSDDMPNLPIQNVLLVRVITSWGLGLPDVFVE